MLNVLSSFLQMRHGVISLLRDDDVPDITVGVGWNEGTDEQFEDYMKNVMPLYNIKPRAGGEDARARAIIG